VEKPNTLWEVPNIEFVGLPPFYYLLPYPDKDLEKMLFLENIPEPPDVLNMLVLVNIPIPFPNESVLPNPGIEKPKGLFFYYYFFATSLFSLD